MKRFGKAAAAGVVAALAATLAAPAALAVTPAVPRPEMPNITVPAQPKNFDEGILYGGVVGTGETVVIKEGQTVTIGEDRKFTVYGTLVVEGTLKNAGTLVVTTQSENVDMNETVTPGQIENKGAIVNSGTVSIANGALRNNPNASFTNDKVVQVNNGAASTYAGISNISNTINGKLQAATTVNNGTITIASPGGVGIRNYQNAVFENKGTITRSKNAEIKGAISGNPVTVAEK